MQLAMPRNNQKKLQKTFDLIIRVVVHHRLFLRALIYFLLSPSPHSGFSFKKYLIVLLPVYAAMRSQLLLNLESMLNVIACVNV